MTEENQAKWISGFWRRLGAFVIDLIILGLFGLGLGLLLEDVFVALGAWGRAVGFVIALVYFGVLNSQLASGQTLGKKVLNIRVVNADNQPISLPRSFGRFCIIGVPFFLNNAQFPPEMLTSWWAYLLSIGIIGGLFAIAYLFIFNRHTRQSLHDLVVGSYVVKTGVAKQQVTAVWRPHIVVVSLLFAISAIVPLFMSGLLQQQQFADLLKSQQIIQDNPAVSYASVYFGKNVTSTVRTGTMETTYVSAQVFLKQNETNNTQLARDLARVIAAHYREVLEKDLLEINLIYGYDIGIASKWNNHAYRFNPGEFGVKPKPDDAKIQHI